MGQSIQRSKDFLESEFLQVQESIISKIRIIPRTATLFPISEEEVLVISTRRLVLLILTGR
jgi:hypothetical protein